MACYFHILFDDLGGCETKTIAELGKVCVGSTPSRINLEYWCQNGIPWLLQGDLTSNIFKFATNGEDDITQKGYESCSTKLVPEGTILFPRVGPYNKIYISGKTLCFSSEVRGIILDSPKNREYVYFFLKERHLEIQKAATATIFDSISKEILEKFEIQIPSNNTIKKFNNICERIFELQKNNEKEIRELMNLQRVTIEKLN